MKSSTVFLSDLNDTSKNYKVKVKVIEKGRPKTSTNKGVAYQGLVLQDDKGNRMRGALFGDQIDSYKEALVYNGVYEIANAPIKPVSERWKMDPAELDFQMSFGRQTIVQDVAENSRPPMPDYKRISQLPRAFNQSEKYDVLGIVLYVEETSRQIVTTQQREYSVREIFVADQSTHQPLTISAWNDLAENECAQLDGWHEKLNIVGFTALKVTAHKGFSMSTTMSTTFIVNPAGDMADTLRTWAGLNHSSLLNAQSRILNVKFSAGGLHVTNVAAILAKKRHDTLPEERHRLNIVIPDPQLDKLNAYLGCTSCGKKTDTPAGQKFNCEWCSQRGGLSCPRVTFQCQVSDGTAMLPLTFFNADAETLFAMPAQDLFRIRHTDDIDTFQVLGERLKTHLTLIEIGPNGLLSRNGILHWVLKKVVSDNGQAAPLPLPSPDNTSKPAITDSTNQLPVSTPADTSIATLSVHKDNTLQQPEMALQDQAHTPARKAHDDGKGAADPEISTPPRKKQLLLQTENVPATPEQTTKAPTATHTALLIRTVKQEAAAENRRIAAATKQPVGKQAETCAPSNSQ